MIEKTLNTSIIVLKQLACLAMKCLGIFNTQICTTIESDATQVQVAIIMFDYSSINDRNRYMMEGKVAKQYPNFCMNGKVQNAHYSTCNTRY